MSLPVNAPVDANAPIGVFDSGLGGLSILQALRTEMPHERFVYVADSGHAPYGERDEQFVIARSRSIARHLRGHHHIKALVVACNTATAAAVHMLRQEHGDLPVVGVEPALKPAVAASRTGHIAVIATRGTLSSLKFRKLLDSVSEQASFHLQACDGLASAIERADSLDAPEIIALCARYMGALGNFGIEPGQMDTLVLGCTHYPFVRSHLQLMAGPAVQLIDTGEPVARQTFRLLAATRHQGKSGDASVKLETTGAASQLQNVARHWLGLEQAAQPVSV